MLATRVRQSHMAFRGSRRLPLAASTRTKPIVLATTTPSGRTRLKLTLWTFDRHGQFFRSKVTPSPCRGLGTALYLCVDMETFAISRLLAEHFTAHALLRGVTVAHHTREVR